MSRILAIDPGPTQSAYALTYSTTRKPIHVCKTSNIDLVNKLPYMKAHIVAIEMVASYGMPVGADVFETCVWIGRFAQAWRHWGEAQLVYRRDVKLHLCQSAKAKDANITQALIDRFAKGEPNRGKGTTVTPGWFHGFSGDIWQAYALAVYVADTHQAHALTGAQNERRI